MRSSSMGEPLAFDGRGPERLERSFGRRDARVVRDAPGRLEPADIEARVRRACQSIPPAFPLEDMVAVDPFLGFAEEDFRGAHARVARSLGVDVLPSIEVLSKAFEAGAFDDEDLAAVRGPGPGPGVAVLLRRLRERPVSHGPDVLTVAERLDRHVDEDWTAAVTSAVSRFCAARFDGGIARWRSRAADGGLFAAWRRYASTDLSMDVRGLRGFRRFVRDLPEDARAARLACLDKLGASTVRDLDLYLERLLGDVFGWAGYLRGQAWADGHQEIGALPELLAVRVAYDAGLASLHPVAREGRGTPRWVTPSDELSEARDADRRARWSLLKAWERGLLRQTLADLPARERAQRVRPRVQAVFCIDVRSEPLRRQIERADGAIETVGFAGFFGLPIEVGAGEGATKAQLPPLLEPAHRLSLEGANDGSRGGIGMLLDAFKRSAVSCFSYVETVGLGYLGPMLAEVAGVKRRPKRAPAEVVLDTLPLEARVGLVEGLMAGTGMRPPRARLLLLCGHESVVDNNPQAAGLGCGACRGHSGEINARLAARLVNDPAVREVLAERGTPIPEDTLAVAGVHDTVTDRIRIVGVDDVPESHRADLEWLEAKLEVACADAGCTRAATLGDAPRKGSAIARDLERRGTDWSEVRPEWGLAGNAGFIAARRDRTRGVDLGGRWFLHDYDESLDPDGSVLELILTAPVVVASWINLQYYASTVAPERYGSGSKTIHNVSAGVGVVEGNEGDLAQGLSLQSVHDGERNRHEPLRLQVLVEASPERIDRVLAAHDGIQRLVEGEWIVLHALDPSGDGCRARLPEGGWTPVG